MRFSQKTADIFVPDGSPIQTALTRTTHMVIAAHQDDIEIMAAAPILECYQRPDKWFTGVVVTDGRGSPRANVYAGFTDEQMHDVRMEEQRKAATVGDYSAQVLLDIPSKVVKDAANEGPVKDLAELLRACRPQTLWTHNLADKHDTHVSVVLRVIDALRQLPADELPKQVIGCEVWRGLDWMPDADKIVMDLTGGENLQNALLGVFDSQIAGGKRYDLGSMGRRRANATYLESHEVDKVDAASLGMDLTPLIHDRSLDPADYVDRYIERFHADVRERLRKFSGI
ncbi:MAG TPA: PIG-L family deacetylase [Bellilinea sp.]|nr:PIG-L family deacetylase [Bellilinea sp.]